MKMCWVDRLCRLCTYTYVILKKSDYYAYISNVHVRMHVCVLVCVVVSNENNPCAVCWWLSGWVWCVAGGWINKAEPNPKKDRLINFVRVEDIIHAFSLSLPVVLIMYHILICTIYPQRWCALLYFQLVIVHKACSVYGVPAWWPFCALLYGFIFPILFTYSALGIKKYIVGLVIKLSSDPESAEVYSVIHFWRHSDTCACNFLLSLGCWWLPIVVHSRSWTLTSFVFFFLFRERRYIYPNWILS